MLLRALEFGEAGENITILLDGRFPPTLRLGRLSGKVGNGALRTVPAVQTERPLWVSKSGPLPLMIGPRSLS
jgi:hypothetical protein